MHPVYYIAKVISHAVQQSYGRLALFSLFVRCSLRYLCINYSLKLWAIQLLGINNWAIGSFMYFILSCFWGDILILEFGNHKNLDFSICRRVVHIVQWSNEEKTLKTYLFTIFSQKLLTIPSYHRFGLVGLGISGCFILSYLYLRYSLYPAVCVFVRADGF